MLFQKVKRNYGATELNLQILTGSMLYLLVYLFIYSGHVTSTKFNEQSLLLIYVFDLYMNSLAFLSVCTCLL